MRANKLIVIILLIFSIGLASNFGREKKDGNAEIKVRTIHIEKLFKIGDLKPCPGKYPLIGNYKIFDVDDEANFYFVDYSKHRILKYKPDGTFILQIGSIGQDESGLYKPSAIHIHENSIYVNNKDGVEIKQFSLKGDFISSFSLKKVRRGSHIDIYKDRIYTNVRLEKRNYNDTKLIQVYSKDGKNLASFGKIVQSHRFSGYLSFNTNYFRIRKGFLIGAFQNVPILFRYNLKGELLSYIDLRELGVPEANAIEKDIQRNKYDTPQNIKQSNGYVRFASFCRGFDVDERLYSYFSIITPANIPYVYIFDQNGKIVNKILLKEKEDIIFAKGLFADKKSNVMYGIGRSLTISDVFLFKFEVK